MIKTNAIVLNEIGEPNCLKFQEQTLENLEQNQVLISQKTIGVNFIDIYYRKGLYPLEKLPVILGTEACGYIEELGSSVTGFKVGDRVAYATSRVGAYSQHRNIDSNYLVSVPEFITDEVVSAFLTKGLTAHYLLKRCFFVRPQDVILVHAASGGVGKILCQWARYIGAKVIGTVGSDEKIKIAKASGCEHVINYNKDNFKDAVLGIYPEGVSVVYDSVGKDTLLDSVACLKKYGLLVSYGQASGDIGPVDLGIFSKNSNFFTRPSLFHYKSNRMELVLGAAELFEMIKNKRFKLDQYNKYNLKDASLAHQDIESRKNTGSTILTV